MKTRPILPVAVLLLVLIAALAATAFIIMKNPTGKKEKAGTMIRLSFIYVLTFLIGLRPMVSGSDYEFSASNMDVIFVVDTTISMWAEDHGSRHTRIQSAVKDAFMIIDELKGANYSIITFDNRSRVLSPFTQEFEYIKDTINTLAAPEVSNADGSNMSLPRENLTSLIRSASKKENRKTLVFFMSDGENTNGKETESYAELSEYISGGAVIGYGSDTGGRMRNKNGGYIYDGDAGQFALSRIDEENLKKIASDLGISYINSSSDRDGLKGVITTIRENARTVTDHKTGVTSYRDVYYIFAILLACIILYEMVRIIRKGRL